MAGNPTDFLLLMVKIGIERKMTKVHCLHSCSAPSLGALGGAHKDGPQNWAKMEPFRKLSLEKKTLSTCQANMAKTKTSWGRKDFKTVISSQKQEATFVPISEPEFSRKGGLKSLAGGSAADWAQPRAWGLCGEVLPPKGEEAAQSS